MTVGTKVLLFGKTAATVLDTSSNGKRLHVKTDGGKVMWTMANNATVVGTKAAFDSFLDAHVLFVAVG